MESFPSLFLTRFAFALLLRMKRRSRCFLFCISNAPNSQISPASSSTPVFSSFVLTAPPSQTSFFPTPPSPSSELQFLSQSLCSSSLPQTHQGFFVNPLVSVIFMSTVPLKYLQYSPVRRLPARGKMIQPLFLQYPPHPAPHPQPKCNSAETHQPQ